MVDISFVTLLLLNTPLNNKRNYKFRPLFSFMAKQIVTKNNLVTLLNRKFQVKSLTY